VATVAFSVEPSQSPSGIFDALGRDPERDHVGVSLQLAPVDHHHRKAHVVEADGSSARPTSGPSSSTSYGTTSPFAGDVRELSAAKLVEASFDG